MGQLDDLPNSMGADDANTAETILKTVTQDLKHLQQSIVVQLTQDVEQLRVEKSRLQDDIAGLKMQQQTLENQHQSLLSQRQLAQQQVWAKQLAQALANHLQAVLVQRLNQSTQAAPASLQGTGQLAPSQEPNYSENAYRLLASLDTSLHRTLGSVREDLASYQSGLSQQIGRMQSLEQQGEAILEALVSRLNQHLQADLARPQPSGASGSLGGSLGSDLDSLAGSHAGSNLAAPLSGLEAIASASSYYNPATPTSPATPRARMPKVLPVAPATAPAASFFSSRLQRLQGLSQFQLGLVLILLSTLALSLHNVVVGVIGNPSSLFGWFDLGGYIRLNSMGNSLLILWMRMLVVVPLMMLMAQFLYPSAWKDIKAFALSDDRPLLRNVVGSGFFLFLSQVMIYIAIGQIGPGVAVTILFMYPIITVPLAWVLFGDRPSQVRVIVMVAICLGIILAALPNIAATGRISWLGISTAILSGIAFACYLIAMQISFRKLHPIPVSLIQFGTIFVLTSLSLIFLPLRVEVLPGNQPGLIMGGIVLGILTLFGYLLNNFGVRYMGAARASIVASSGPALTALLAFLITPGPRTALQSVQILGILIVTLAVTALSLERLAIQRRSGKTTPASR